MCICIYTHTVKALLTKNIKNKNCLQQIKRVNVFSLQIADIQQKIMTALRVYVRTQQLGFSTWIADIWALLLIVCHTYVYVYLYIYKY